MRDIDDVEHAEGDRNAGGDGGIEAAEHQAGDDRVDQKIEIHAAWTGGPGGNSHSS